MSLEKYASKGDSISLAKIDGEEFTIVGIEDSDYTETKDGVETVTPGVKITTSEMFNGLNKFHTTRVAIVSKLTHKELRADVSNGTKLKVKCVKVTFKNGKPGFDLESV